MEYEKGSSGTSKAALATGITGSVLGGLALLGETMGLNGRRQREEEHGRALALQNHPDYIHRSDRDHEDRKRQENDRRHEQNISRREMELMEQINRQNDEITRFKTEQFTTELIARELAPIHAAIAAQGRAIDRLEGNAAMTARDIKDVHEWAERTFIPQEPGLMDGRRVLPPIGRQSCDCN